MVILCSKNQNINRRDQSLVQTPPLKLFIYINSVSWDMLEQLKQDLNKILITAT